MKFRKFLCSLCLLTFFFMSSCEKEPIASNSDSQSLQIRAKKGGKGNGNGGGTTTASGAYVLTQVGDFDALSSFNLKGKKATLFSDPSVASWGSDFYGNWAGSFQLSSNAIQYTKGLTQTTYRFNFLSNGAIEVDKTLVVQPYSSNGTPTVTNSYVGIFSK